MNDNPQMPPLIPTQELVPPQTPNVGTVPIGTKIDGALPNALLVVGKGPFLQHTGTGLTFDPATNNVGVAGSVSSATLGVSGVSSFGGDIGVAGTAFLGTAALSGSLTVTGSSTLSTLSASGLASLSTLNTTGLASLNSLLVTNAATLSSTLAVTGLSTLTGGVKTNLIYPPTDGTAALNITKADGSTPVLVFDTTNVRVGVGMTPTRQIEVAGFIKAGNGFIGTTIGPNSDSTLAIKFTKADLTTVIGTVDTTNSHWRFDTAVAIGMNVGSRALELSTDSAQKPTTNTWTITSDKRSKEQIEPFTAGMPELRRMKPKIFIYNGAAHTIAGARGVGFIAQELIKVAPEMVETHRGKLRETDRRETDIYSYQGHNLSFMHHNAILELDARLAKLEKAHA